MNSKLDQRKLNEARAETFTHDADFLVVHRSQRGMFAKTHTSLVDDVIEFLDENGKGDLSKMIKKMKAEVENGANPMNLYLSSLKICTRVSVDQTYDADRPLGYYPPATESANGRTAGEIYVPVLTREIISYAKLYPVAVVVEDEDFARLTEPGDDPNDCFARYAPAGTVVRPKWFDMFGHPTCAIWVPSPVTWHFTCVEEGANTKNVGDILKGI